MEQLLLSLTKNFSTLEILNFGILPIVLSAIFFQELINRSILMTWRKKTQVSSKVHYCRLNQLKNMFF